MKDGRGLTSSEVEVGGDGLAVCVDGGRRGGGEEGRVSGEAGRTVKTVVSAESSSTHLFGSEEVVEGGGEEGFVKAVFVIVRDRFFRCRQSLNRPSDVRVAPRHVRETRVTDWRRTGEPVLVAVEGGGDE
jgi:hypothetical protein